MLKLFLIFLTSLGMELAEQSKPMVRDMQRNAPSQLTGVVKGPDGQPVEGVSVAIMPDHSSSGQKTDADGKYQIKWRPSNVSWVEGDLYVLARKKEGKLAGSATINPDSKTADIVLSKSFLAKGKVVNPEGETLGGASISITFWGGNWGTSMDNRGGANIKSDSNGEYEVPCLPEGHKFSINARGVKGYGSGRKEFRTDLGVEDNIIELEDIVLQVADMKISGKVVDEDGNGISDVNLHIYGTDQPSLSVKSDKEGNFLFDAVCSGRASIQANYQKDNQYLYSNVETEGGAEDVVLVISKRPSYRSFVPRVPSTLIDQKLPDMTKYGVPNPESGKPVLLFFWDIKQRPSRHFIKMLAGKKEFLESKGVNVLLIHNGNADPEMIINWLKGSSLAFESQVLDKEVEDAKFNLGLKAMPWLVLTDADLKVVAEGFSMEELEIKLN